MRPTSLCCNCCSPPVVDPIYASGRMGRLFLSPSCRGGLRHRPMQRNWQRLSRSSTVRFESPTRIGISPQLSPGTLPAPTSVHLCGAIVWRQVLRAGVFFVDMVRFAPRFGNVVLPGLRFEPAFTRAAGFNARFSACAASSRETLSCQNQPPNRQACKEVLIEK